MHKIKTMEIKSINITTKNLINKYNNSMFEVYEDEEMMIVIDMYTAS